MARLTMETERARQAEEEAQRQVSVLQEALESLRSGDNPHLALHQLQLLHRLPLESVVSLQAQLCSCLHTVEQVGGHWGPLGEQGDICSRSLQAETTMTRGVSIVHSEQPAAPGGVC